MQFRRELGIAYDDVLEFEEVALEINLSNQEREIWWHLARDWEQENMKTAYLAIGNRGLGYQEHPYHRLLGLPYCGNYDGRTVIAGENWETEAVKWRLLLQLSSNDGLEWGGGGTISFFIRRDALRNGDFSDVRVSYDG